MPSKENDKSPSDDLTAEVRKARRALEAFNSPLRRFSLGIVAGIGSAIGATLIAALLFYTLSQLLSGTLIESYFQPILKQQTQQAPEATQF